jgi:hypothetical protein
LHKVNAKMAGWVLPSLPQGGVWAKVVLAQREVLHPIALAPNGFADMWLSRFYRYDFGPGRAFAEAQIALAEAYRQCAIQSGARTPTMV